MEHQEALNTMAAERYLLHEMSDQERDAFEEHFFDCPACAADVTDGVAFRETFREVAAEEPKRKVIPFREPNRVRLWLQTAAAAILSFSAGWLGALQRVEPILIADSVYQIEAEQQRGPEGEAPTQLKSNERSQMDLFVPHDDAADSYVLSIRGSDGKNWKTKKLTRRRAQDSVSVLVRPLPAGQYKVVIEGVRKEGNRFTITEIPFDVVEER